MLAETLGMTVGELLRKISSKEIAEWKAYYKIKEEEEKKVRQKSRGKLGG